METVEMFEGCWRGEDGVRSIYTRFEGGLNKFEFPFAYISTWNMVSIFIFLFESDGFQLYTAEVNGSGYGFL